MKVINIRKAPVIIPLVIMVIFSGFIVYGGINTPLSDMPDNNADSNEINSTDLPESSPSDAADASFWWDENFDSRVKYIITEPNIRDRTNEPVTIFRYFENETCHVNSTRIVYFDGSTQTEQPSQIWNITLWDSSDYVKSASITFSVSIEKGQSKTYYLYYSSQAMESKEDDYYAQTKFSSTLTNGRATVDTNKLYVEFAEGSGIDVLKYSSSDTINFHTSTSMSPFSSVLSGASSTVYYPDANGFIRDWLIVGSFSEGTDWNNYPTMTGNHVDPTRLYVEGDHATPEDPAISGSDSSKTWSAHHDADDLIDFNSLFSPNDYVAGYALTYVYIPQDEPTVYVKVGSDDGIRVIIDRGPEYGGQEFYNHVLRGVGTDQDVWEISGGLTKGWHSIFVMVEERTGGFSFRLRLSTTGETTFTPISGMQVKLVPEVNIQDITLIEEGPIFSQYRVTWEDSGTMKTWDTLTFYQGLEMYKAERTFWWKDDINETNGNDWNILNTYYTSPSTTGIDSWVMDGSSSTITLTSDGFIATKYILAYDKDSTNGLNYYTGQGVFLTSFWKGNALDPNFVLTSINLSAFYKNDLPQIIPGYQTDLDNNGPRTGNYPTQSDYNVTVEWWEITKKYMGIGSETINQEANGIYEALTHPLEVSTDDNVEALFFNLEIHLYDTDGLGAPNVNITLYNTTENWSGIDPNFTPVSGLSNSSGGYLFTKLKGANYTCNITYQVYNKPAYHLRTINITLNTTKSVNVYYLNLTRLQISLLNYDDDGTGYHEPIYGANVSLYWNNTDSSKDPWGGFVGSEVSDDTGTVNFYYINSSEAEGNYTVKVKYFGNWRYLSLNTSIPAADTQVNFTVAQSTIKTIYVKLEPYSTELNDSDTVGVNTHYWGQILDINYTYSWSYGSGAGATSGLIGGATLTYTIKYDQAVVKNGTLTETAQSGVYNLTFNSSDPSFGLDVNKVYILEVHAEKGGYEPADRTILFEIRGISTVLAMESTQITSYWLDNFTIYAYFNDTSNNVPITDAEITYECLQNPAINGTLLMQSPGVYFAELNSTIFGESGAYLLQIEAKKSHYVSQTDTISLTINKIQTEFKSVNASMEVLWGTNFTLAVTLKDLHNNVWINDANVSYNVAQVSGVEGTFTKDPNTEGRYLAEIDTHDFVIIGTYSIHIVGYKNQYEIAPIDLFITILPIDTRINDSIFLQAVETINVTTHKSFVFYYGADSGSGIEGAEIAYYEWQLSGSDTTYKQNLIDLGDGYYSLGLDTSILPVGTYLFVIHLGKLNYNERSATITLKVEDIPIKIELADELSDYVVSKPKGDNITIEITLIDPLTGEPLHDADVVMYFNGRNITMEEVGDGVYRTVIDTNSDEFKATMTAETYQAQIYITKANYTAPPIQISISVRPAEFNIGGTAIPKIFVYIGVAVLGFVSVVYGTVKYIQYANIPDEIKRIRETKKVIEKGGDISDIKVLPSREEVFADVFGKSWELIGLSLKDILNKNNESDFIAESDKKTEV